MRSRVLSTVATAALVSLFVGCPGGGAIDPCANGVQDGDETGVDCGGGCGLCPGEPCEEPEVCASDACGDDGECRAPTCDDGVQNGTERGVDCGGSCPDACLPATCSNGVQDPGEDGVDCGGLCPPCSDDPCENLEQDPGETDVDCGGPSCDPCPPGAACERGDDCETGICSGGACITEAETCDNGELDPNETDVDCGGSCPPCANTKLCEEHSDCLSASCVFGTCATPTCDDDVRNQDETDVDCGGSCGPCADGLGCAAPSDCASGVCEGGRCVSCSDGARNQDETDVDCGGSCEPCGIDRDCGGHGDCASRTCIEATCRPEGTSAGACSTDDDCASPFYCAPDWNGVEGAGAAVTGRCLARRGGAPRGADCIEDDDCDGVGCVNAHCTAACERDDDCGDGVCAYRELYLDTSGDGGADAALPYGLCLYFSSPEGSCLAQSDCSTNAYCNIHMVPDPDGDADSPFKAVGRCEAPGFGSPEGWECEVHADCQRGYCSPQGLCANPCRDTAGCQMITVGGQTPYYSICTAALRWAGGQIDTPAAYVYVSYCAAMGTDATQPTACGPDAAGGSCANDDVCSAYPVDFGPDYEPHVSHYCAPPVGSGQTGAACTSASACASGFCVPSASGGGHCTEPCVPAEDHCGDFGLTCKPYTDIGRAGVYAGNSLTYDVCRD